MKKITHRWAIQKEISRIPTIFQFSLHGFRTVTMAVVRDRKILPAPGTIQIVV